MRLKKSLNKFGYLATLLMVSALACNFTSPVADQPVVASPSEDASGNDSSDTVCTSQVIEQSFENGFMFWIGRTSAEKCAQSHSFDPESGEIWVAYVNASIPSGKWQVFVDDWTPGTDPDNDASLTPPAGLIQPIRGFGKVWRLRLSVSDRAMLGWATGAEFLISSEYTYVSDEFTNSQGEVIHRPGKHILVGLAGDIFTFDEVSQTVSYTAPPQP